MRRLDPPRTEGLIPAGEYFLSLKRQFDELHAQAKPASNVIPLDQRRRAAALREGVDRDA